MSNRNQRRSTSVYRLVPLFEDEGTESGFGEGPPHYIEGELETYQIVSVPPTTSHASAMSLRDALSQSLSKSIIIITHNTCFMKVEKLSAKEGSAVIKKFKGVDEPLVKVISE